MSSSSLAFDLNLGAWDVTLGGLRELTNWKACDLNGDQVVDDGYPRYTVDPADGSLVWEWPIIYEMKIDMTACGCVEGQGLVEIHSAHNSPAKGGTDIDVPIPPEPTPVTLSYFAAERVGSTTRFEWSTATETGNLGFNLYAQIGDQRQQINEALILSHVVDSLVPQAYAYQADGLSADTFWIEDMDVLGHTEMRGPFELGRSYGDRTSEDDLRGQPARIIEEPDTSTVFIQMVL
jgi:hypothetical protein